MTPWTHIAHPSELREFYESILPAIREAARAHGYAIGLHGSMTRDLDLIAVPWIESFSDPNVLAQNIQIAACGLSQDKYQWEPKPHGRIATAMPVCWIDYNPKRLSEGHIDLSVITNRPQP